MSKNGIVYVPNGKLEALSRERHYDYHYKPPRIVECFIDRANQELPFPFTVKLWSIAMKVSIFCGSEYVGSIMYDTIKDDIVSCLNTLVAQASHHS